MIKEKTVFILGAGASCPYGFPTAAKLREEIHSNANFIHYYINNIIAHDVQKNLLIQKDKEFRTAFESSSIQSIDSFLATNKNESFDFLGKIHIAYNILKHESQSKLSSNWLLYLFNKMLIGLIDENGFKKFNSNNVSFVTFNYDRTIENFFFTSLSNSFKHAPKAEIKNIVERIPIHHVYGTIAKLPWQEKNGIGYGNKEPSGQDLKGAAKSLKTIHEIEEYLRQNPSGHLDLSDAKRDIAKADKVFILGFGFDHENMNILGLPKIINSQICSTVYGLEEGEIVQIINKFISELIPDRKLVKQSRELNLDNIKFEKDMDCLKLLRNYL